MKDTKVQVILCCYQGEAYIAEQLDSILGQTYPSIELHVFDDCSTDMTVSIIQKYALKHPTIRLHINDVNIGFVKNFENALKNTSGKYFALADQDDIWHLDKIEVSMIELKKIENEEPCKPILIHSDLTLINEKGVITESSFFLKKGLSFSEKKSLPQMLGHCGVMGNTILMNKQLVDMALPFPVGLKYHDYWLAVINECFGVRKTIVKSLIKYRIHQDNNSNNNSKKKSVTLPFMQDMRLKTIEYLLTNYSFDKKDSMLISHFHSYLNFNGGRASHFVFLLQNGFFKSGVVYRISAFFKILLSNNFNTKK